MNNIVKDDEISDEEESEDDPEELEDEEMDELPPKEEDEQTQGVEDTTERNEAGSKSLSIVIDTFDARIGAKHVEMPLDVARRVYSRPRKQFRSETEMRTDEQGNPQAQSTEAEPDRFAIHR